MPTARASRALKRAFDVALAGTGLVATAPLSAGVALGVWATMGRPLLFKQKRVGHNERVFTVLKFRTMLEPGPGRTTDAERISKFGDFLRKSSLDEIPQLVNILKGDMSLVGPRPLLIRYLGRYSSAQRRRHAVRPGLTGLAQVRGRNGLTWRQKFEADLEYVDDPGARQNLRILVKTVRAVTSRGNISASGHATMPEFTGD